MKMDSKREEKLVEAISQQLIEGRGVVAIAQHFGVAPQTVISIRKSMGALRAATLRIHKRTV